MVSIRRLLSKDRSGDQLAKVLSIAMLPALVASLYRTLVLDPNLFAAFSLGCMYIGLVVLGWLPNLKASSRIKGIALLFFWLAIHVVFRLPESGLDVVVSVVAGFILSSAFTGPSKFVVSFIPVFVTVGVHYLVHSPPVLNALHALFGACGGMSVAVALIGRLNTELKTERNRVLVLNESLASQIKRHETLSSAANIAFFEIDLDAQTVDGDKTLQSRFGRTENAGAFVLSEYPWKYPEEAMQTIGKALAFALEQPAGVTVDITYQEFLADGEAIYVRTIGQKAIYNGRNLFLGASIDITNDVKAQEQIQQQLSLINEQNQKQAQMFSVIGHELRTPLSSMKMMEDAMDLRNIGEYGVSICESTDAVLNIVDDLRTIINPEKARQAQAVVDSPFYVLSRTTRSLEGLYEQEGVDVQVTADQLSHSLCKFNAQALRQMITNLNKNAAIHADADRVWVDLQAQSRGDGQIDLTLTVEDNGKGIPEGLREAVFGAFSRGDTRADGTGLGLYITRELAQKLDGTVEYFESSKGGAGFKVGFTLDLHLDAEEQEVVEEAIPVALQGKRILFAEDQKTLQLLTSKLLQDAGAEVVVCDNGKQALEAFRAGEFDIVLTDLMMPEMTGDELIRYIRADGFTGQVVALTAAIIGKETEALLEAGSDAVLNKPLDIQEMKRTVAVLENKEVGA